MTASTAGDKDGDTPSLDHALVMSVTRHQEEPFLLRTNNRMIVVTSNEIVYQPVLARQLVQVIPVLLGPTFLLLEEDNMTHDHDHDHHHSHFWEHGEKKNMMSHTLEILEMALELLDEEDDDNHDPDHHHHHHHHDRLIGAGKDKQRDNCDRHDDKVQ